MTPDAPDNLHGAARWAVPSLAVVIVLLALVVSCAVLSGCVSQGEFDAVQKTLADTKTDLSEAAALNETVTADLIAARDVIRELREWIKAQRARIERLLLGGER